jgi:hypothetical protein
LLRRTVSGECCHLPFLSVANARGDLLISPVQIVIPWSDRKANPEALVEAVGLKTQVFSGTTNELECSHWKEWTQYE